jgi:hypothetical protein
MVGGKVGLGTVLQAHGAMVLDTVIAMKEPPTEAASLYDKHGNAAGDEDAHAQRDGYKRLPFSLVELAFHRPASLRCCGYWLKLQSEHSFQSGAATERVALLMRRLTA